MNWEKELDQLLDVLGSTPSSDQVDRLESWIIHNVPATAFRTLVMTFDIPDGVHTELSMRAGELGV